MRSAAFVQQRSRVIHCALLQRLQNRIARIVLRDDRLNAVGLVVSRLAFTSVLHERPFFLDNQIDVAIHRGLNPVAHRLRERIGEMVQIRRGTGLVLRGLRGGIVLLPNTDDHERHHHGEHRADRRENGAGDVVVRDLVVAGNARAPKSEQPDSNAARTQHCRRHKEPRRYCVDPNHERLLRLCNQAFRSAVTSHGACEGRGACRGERWPSP